ncbi:exosortase A [Photobacterium sanguinicancri]|uniref:exosortase A n=1 Tax=Photobacterium sanguinicancri TaxID=875932 RepID=UPI0026E321FA|nr:exosortase A [Photobacterium sanguinicancri]MDO6497995.1 exosortase A [Photobacterium sanguinicancri]
MNNSIILRLMLPLAAWGLVFSGSLQTMVSVWMQSKTYEHCFLIVPISLWLVWQKRQDIRKVPYTSSWIPLFLLIFPAMLWLLGRAADISLFQHVASVVSLQLIIWAVIGTPMAKLLWFPILFLIFAAPFGEELVPALQIITADLSVFFLNIVNIPVYREGLYLTIPNGQFHVAEACSGIRFLISSIALGTLFAYLQFNHWWKRILFTGFSFIFPIVANGLRAFGIITIGYLSDMEHATGADHLVYGWVFFSIVILVIFFTANIFADPPAKSTDFAFHNVSTEKTDKSLKVIGCLTMVLLSLGLWEQSFKTNDIVAKNAKLMPNNVTPISQSKWGIQFQHAQQHVLGQSQDGSVEYFNAIFSLRQDEGEIINQNNQLFNKKHWREVASQVIQLTPDLDATEVLVLNDTGTQMKIIYWYCVDDFCSSKPIDIKWAQATHLITGQNATAEVLAVASTTLSEKTIRELAKQWQ